MPYRIARSALHDFVDRQISLIESTPFPSDIRTIVPQNEVGDDQLRGIWLGAGLATQVGIALIEEPERWVEATRES